MKPKVKITVPDAEKLTKVFSEVNLSFTNLSNALNKTEKRSSFEKFYDSISTFLSKGESFAPNELKSFK